MSETEKHKHNWIASCGALLGTNYPSFIIQYFCDVGDCEEVKYELEEGFEL